MIQSTRSNNIVTASQAILNGLAPDGGLYVFKDILPLPIDFTKYKNYRDIATIVFRHLLDDFSDQSIQDIIQSTYNTDHFKPHPTTISYKDNYAYLELYKGPTFAFKDMALQVLPKLVDEAKKINQITKPSLILTATSGDTGSAALAGFKENENNHVIVLYPTNGVSRFQELQMNQYASDNLHIYGIDGNFDDCQNIVKQLFMEDTSEGILLTSANSINIGRLIPQVVYYVSAYVDALQAGKLQIDQEYKIVVPTGNFGNIYAGYLAKQLGLPIKQLIIASNHNDVLDHFFKTGQYTIDRNLKKSISPSMDIVISSNLERYLYALLNQDVSKIKKLMETLQNQKTITVPEILNQKEFISGMASEQDTKNTIRNSLHKDSYLLDPHTAVAKSVYDQMQDPSIFTFIVSTASPYKFVDAMNESLNLESKDTLEENMKSLASYSNTTIDPRILDLLHSTPSKQVLKKDQAIPFLKQKIGDINDL